MQRTDGVGNTDQAAHVHAGSDPGVVGKGRGFAPEIVFAAQQGVQLQTSFHLKAPVHRAAYVFKRVFRHDVLAGALLDGVREVLVKRTHGEHLAATGVPLVPGVVVVNHRALQVHVAGHHVAGGEVVERKGRQLPEFRTVYGLGKAQAQVLLVVQRVHQVDRRQEVCIGVVDLHRVVVVGFGIQMLAKRLQSTAPDDAGFFQNPGVHLHKSVPQSRVGQVGVRRTGSFADGKTAGAVGEDPDVFGAENLVVGLVEQAKIKPDQIQIGVTKLTGHVSPVAVLAAYAHFQCVPHACVRKIPVAFPGGLGAVQVFHVGAVEPAAGVVGAYRAGRYGCAPTGVCGVVYVSVGQGVAQVRHGTHNAAVPGQPLHFLFFSAHHVLAGQLRRDNLVVGEPTGGLLQNVVRCVQGVVLAVAGQHPVLGRHRVKVLPAVGVLGRRIVRHIEEGTAQGVHGVVLVREIALQLAGLGTANGVHPRLPGGLVVVVGVVVGQGVNDAKLAAVVPGFGPAARVLGRESRGKGFALQGPVVGECFGVFGAFGRRGLEHLERPGNASGQRAAAVVHAQPIQLAPLVIQAFASGGDGVVSAGNAELVELFAREILGVHLDHAPGKFARHLRRSRLHNDQVFQQGRRENIK